MADETVTLPRETLVTIHRALKAAIDGTVAASYLCDLNDYGLPHGVVCALKVCIAKTEEEICDSENSLRDVLGVAHG